MTRTSNTARPQETTIQEFLIFCLAYVSEFWFKLKNENHGIFRKQ